MSYTVLSLQALQEMRTCETDGHKFIDNPHWTTERAIALLNEVEDLRVSKDITDHVCRCINTLDEVSVSVEAARITPTAFKEYLTTLFQQLSRYRIGDLTEEEIHNLCHNLHLKKAGVTRQEFEEGCRQYQDKLFGEE